MPGASGSVSGVFWNDADRDRVVDPGEAALAGWTVFDDVDRDGRLDSGEARAITDATGRYRLDGLSAGLHAIAAVPMAGWAPTFPAPAAVTPAVVIRGEMPGGAESGTIETTPLDVATAAADFAVLGTATNIAAFRADARFADVTGRGTAVVVIDTGADLDHPVFGPDADGNGVADRIVFQYDFTGFGDEDAGDANGHGTHVAGIVGSGDLAFPGIAPGADLVVLRTLDERGSGSWLDIAEALDWVIENSARYDIAAVNLSLGSRDFHTEPHAGYLASRFQALANAGVVAVAASGNGYGGRPIQGVAYPSSDPNVLSVGAVWPAAGSSGASQTGSVDAIAFFSQRDDTESDIFAPGVRIAAAANGGGFVSLSGTSMAAPQIAGMVALAQDLAQRELGRRLGFDEIRDLLKETGRPIIDGDDENDTVPNTGLTFQRVDMLRFAEAILDLVPPGAHAVEIVAGGLAEGASFGFSQSSGVQAGVDGDRIYGTALGDILTGGPGADVISGNDGDDRIASGAGDDRLQGGRGDDAIDGGGDFDDLALVGRRAEYAIAFDAARGVHVLTSVREGRDEVTGVERFEFANVALAVAELVDVTSPRVVAAPRLQAGAPIVLQFSETIERGAGAIVVRSASGAVLESFDAAASGRVAVAGNRLTLTPAAPLEPGAAIEVDIAVGAVVDLAGNPYAEISSFDVAVADMTPPALVSGGATLAADRRSVTVTFDEPLADGAPPASAFVATAGGQSVAIESVIVTGQTARVNFLAPLAPGEIARVAYTDPAGDQAAAVLQDVDGNDVASFVATATPATLPALGGIAYHWNSHALLSGTTATVTGDGKASASFAAPFQIRALAFDTAGDARFELWVDAGAGIENLDVALTVGGGAPIAWTQATLPGAWGDLVVEATPGRLAVGGIGTAPLTGAVKLGSVVVDLAAGTNQLRIDIEPGHAGASETAGFATQLTRSTTGSAGSFQIVDLVDDRYALSLARGTADTGSAINSADALAALKIAVGRNPNVDPDGTGPLQPLLTSPYQFIAADVTGNGVVNSQDALAILKMAVGRADAPARDWIFVAEEADFWNEATGKVSLTSTTVTYAKPPFTVDPATGQAVNYVGILKGDVNGSWKAGTGAQTLDTSYFEALAERLGVPAAIWGVSGVSGTVIDGYVSGATVFRDVNRDGALSAGEVAVLTNGSGRFSGLLGSAADPIVALGGTDTTTSAPFLGTFKAPGTATVVTPLTTLIAELLPATGAPSAAQIAAASSRVATAFGLAAGTDILGTDPIASANLPLLKAGIQVANLIATVGGGANGQAVAARLAVLTAQPVDLTNVAFLTQAIAGASRPLNAAAVADIVAAQNQAIAGAVSVALVLAAQMAQPDVLTLAQVKARVPAPTAGTFAIADTPETIQTALSNPSDSALLTNAASLLALTNSFLTLPSALAAKLLSSNYDVSDTGAAITAAADRVLAGARAILVTQGTASVTVLEASKVTLANGAAYRIVDSAASIQNQIGSGSGDEGGLLAKAAEIAVSGGGEIAMPLALALKLAAGTLYRVVDASETLQARIDGAATNPALDDVLLAAQAVETTDGAILRVPVALAGRLPNGYAVSDSSASIQTQVDGGDAGGKLAGAEEIRVAGQAQAVLVVPVALAEKVTQGGFDIRDTAEAINNAPGDTLAAARNVIVQGGAGDDDISLLALSRGVTIEGLAGDDTLTGGAGNDSLLGGTGHDALDGADGADLLTGGDGADVLTGGAGADTLQGGAGADTLTGGEGNDQLAGGAGADIFVVSTATTIGGTDVVTDFTAGVGGDGIDLLFDGPGEMLLEELHGAGTGYAEVAAGGVIGADTGFVAITGPGGEITTARALAFAIELASNPGNAFVNGDSLLIAFGDGIDVGIFRVSDSVADAGSVFDSAQLLLLLQGTGSAAALAPENIVDFQ
jgi:Ca2+-binding RTX toxin-like protein